MCPASKPQVLYAFNEPSPHVNFDLEAIPPCAKGSDFERVEGFWSAKFDCEASAEQWEKVARQMIDWAESEARFQQEWTNNGTKPTS